MVFSSLEFIYLFLPPVLLVYLVLRALKLETGIILWLITASLAFYAWWNPYYLVLLLGSVGFNYLVHKALVQNPSKVIFAFGTAANLATLALFKYADFLIENVNSVAGLSIPHLDLILPLAISFYTFQQISFLHDTLAGKLVNCDFKRYVLFVTFFPQLIAGPIVMQKDTIPQFTLKNFSNRLVTNLLLGATLFSIGLFKKIVLADSVAPLANIVFTAADTGQDLTMAAAWTGSIAYTFQIYFDFSGYCDMALGLALMFGIRLPMNFNSPYKALSIVDFWRRWHMTLSRFLRDYLYIPLGGNRSGLLGSKGNLMITMLLGGLWHGAGWNFVIWGGLHGGYLIVNHFWSNSTFGATFRSLAGRHLYTVFAWSVTMLAVIIAWVFFRAETLPGALTVLSSMAGLSSEVSMASGAVFADGVYQTLMMFAVMFIIVAFMPNSIQMTRSHRPIISAAGGVKKIGGKLKSLRWSMSPQWATFTSVIFFVTVIQIYRLNGLTEFIYFNF